MSFNVIHPLLRPIAHLTEDPDVSEIMANGSHRVFVKRQGVVQAEGFRAMPVAAVVAAAAGPGARLMRDRQLEQNESPARISARAPTGFP